MNPTQGELADRVRATYVAAGATRETSRRIIDGIATSEGISTAKVRYILTYGGPGYVRWTPETQVPSNTGDDIKIAFLEFNKLAKTGNWREDRRKLVMRLSIEFFCTSTAIESYAKNEGFWPVSEKERKEKLEAARQIESLETRPSVALPLGEPDITNLHQSSNIGLKVTLVAFLVIALFIGYNIRQSDRLAATSVASASSSIEAIAKSDDTGTVESDLSNDLTTRGTATSDERQRYSADLYDKPTSLTSEQNDRYESLSTEGQEAVDRQMELYDRVCARSSDC